METKSCRNQWLQGKSTKIYIEDARVLVGQVGKAIESQDLPLNENEAHSLAIQVFSYNRNNGQYLACVTELMRVASIDKKNVQVED